MTIASSKRIYIKRLIIAFFCSATNRKAQNSLRVNVKADQ